MIASLHGIVQWVEASRMVLDVGGVGYLVNIPTSQNRRPPERGETLLLYTFLQLRENDVSLYGFYTHEELEIFKTLLTVPGIGPRTALAVISVFSPEALRDALTRGDLAALAKVPGIGKKTAQRLIVDLNEKITFNYLQNSNFSGSQPNDDAISALLALGYTSAEAQEALSQVPNEVAALDERIVAALRYLGSH
ncbi:MAG: Holliday junction branch migration protein RuvA [Chloroflexi bacterium]|nr:Holliday junction branch migration protein RuvA [Chloroflexota bacterium]